MLEIVEDEQMVLIREIFEQLDLCVLVCGETQANRFGHLHHNFVTGTNVGQLDEEDAILKLGDCFSSCLQGEARFTNPTRSNHRDQAVLIKQAMNLVQLCLTSDKFR